MKRIYIDMDDTLCDFTSASKKAQEENPAQPFPQSQWGFFLKLKPLEGAIESFHLLSKHFDVWILTRPSYMNINCYSEKASWVLENLGLEALKKLIICCDKSLVKGDYLIDDKDSDGQSDFEGEWIQFGGFWCPDWKKASNYIFKNENISIED